jgi:hypothetical protein
VVVVVVVVVKLPLEVLAGQPLLVRMFLLLVVLPVVEILGEVLEEPAAQELLLLLKGKVVVVVGMHWEFVVHLLEFLD